MSKDGGLERTQWCPGTHGSPERSGAQKVKDKGQSRHMVLWRKADIEGCNKDLGLILTAAGNHGRVFMLETDTTRFVF